MFRSRERVQKQEHVEELSTPPPPGWIIKVPRSGGSLLAAWRLCQSVSEGPVA